MIAFVFFYIVQFQTTHPFCIWDEVVYSHNSISMQENHQWFSYYFFDKINHYNSKPPLVIWLQVLSLKVFGINELAIRIPTLLALLGTLGLLVTFCKMIFKNIFAGIIASLILCSTIGVIRPHVFLTGDLDGVLVFFSTLIFLNVLKAILNNKFDNRFYYQTLAFFILGYFTKSTAIFLIIPSLVLIFLVTKNMKNVLKSKQFYISILIFISTIVVYYYIREKYNPGHFIVVWNSEFLRITKVVMHWHVQPFSFYFENIFYFENKIFSIFSLIFFPIYFILNQTKYKKIVSLLILSVISYLLFVSLPPVKLEWYTAPIYPLWSLAIGIILFDFFEIIQKKNKLFLIVYSLGLILFLSFTTYKIIEHIKAKIIENDYFEKETMLLKTMQNKKWKHYTILMNDEEHDEVFYLYKKIITQKDSCKIDRYKSTNEILIGDTLLVSKKELMDTLQSIYFSREISAFDFGKVYIIDSLKYIH